VLGAAWRVITLPVALVAGWLGMTFISLAAYYRAELVRCEYAPAPIEPGHAYCDFVQQGGSEMLLFQAVRSEG
jgi:hypothetical protein